jgi:hypothetical protein
VSLLGPITFSLFDFDFDFLNKLKRTLNVICKTIDIGPVDPKLHPKNEIIPTPQKVLSSGALRSIPAVHHWILNLFRENFEVVERCLHLASVVLRAIKSKSRSTFPSKNPADILGNRPNPVLNLGLRWRNFDSLGIG